MIRRLLALALSLVFFAGPAAANFPFSFWKNGAPFSPSDIAGLKLWLKADALSLSDGDPVGTWTDSSGNANNATASGSARPTYKVAILNGHAALRFDGTANVMNVASVCAQPLTYFIVGKMTTTSTYYFDGVSGNRFALSDGLNGTPNNLGLYAGGAVVESAFTVAGSAAKLWSGVGNAASSSIFKDGAAFATGNPGTQGLDGGMTIGNRFALSLFLNGDIEEIIVYNTALSAGNRQAVEDYLGAKYGITITH